MKKLLLFLVALVSALTASAQDVIVKTDGSTVLCKVVEVNGSAVVYLKWSDLEGPRYAIERTQISTVNYQDGRQDKMNDQTVNAYSPNNQQTGNWNYNDNALMALDRTKSSAYQAKIKKIKRLGWIIGTPLFVTGVGFLLCSSSISDEEYRNMAIVGGIVGAVSGASVISGCLIRANQIKNKMYQLSCTPLIQHEFDLKNGKSLAAGVDILRDNQFKNTALGVGLKLNF